MSNPVLLRVQRPYPNADAYVAAENWSIDVKGMLLVDEAPHPPGTAVRFDVTLANGEKVIRAEGVVVRHVVPRADRPGGLQVRFKRFGGTTKAFIDRVVASRAAEPRRAPRPTLPSLPEVIEAAIQPVIQELPSEPRASVSSLTPELTSLAPVPPGGTPIARLRERRPGLVSAPADRDAVLARLRQRAAR